MVDLDYIYFQCDLWKFIGYLYGVPKMSNKNIEFSFDCQQDLIIFLTIVVILRTKERCK